MTCNADSYGSDARCMLEENHEGWHEEWAEGFMEYRWRYTRKEEKQYAEAMKAAWEATYPKPE